MSDQQHAKATPDSEAEIWNAIAYFEKIIEALPNDRLSLATLADAYEKVGDHTRSKQYTLRLAEVICDEGDEDNAEDLLSKIKAFDQNDPEVKATVKRLENLKPEKVMAVVMDDQDLLSRRSTNIAGEISMAWNLLQANKINQEDYSRIVHDLSENSARSLDVPVSTLHVLHDMNHPGLNEILSFLATSCGTPVICLANFELSPEAAKLLPTEFYTKRGALFFDLMGNDVLTAILNPYDTKLIQDLEDLTGKTCHCFLTTPADFDGALAKLKNTPAA